MQVDDLYREEQFTDRRVGSIQRLTPVTADGSDDPDRPVLYVGQASLMTPAGALPINFEIEANSLGDAAAKFGGEAQKAVAEAIEQLQEMRREAASGIVVPGQGGGGGGMPPGMGGGGPRGGGIQLR
ncbi:MAG: hypothetical protein EA417_10055 [Gammaproteobacteria bacterium]|nr:MAG: hypothetical protein EA417_10055 [Gammaproteobacteria bacterium]